VLNLRNKRFEVLDSLRTLENAKLAECYKKIINGIKTLWKICYGDTNNQIDKYKLVYIAVPLPQLEEDDIVNIRKISTHKWLSYDENDAQWENILNLAHVCSFSQNLKHFSTKH
jgi:hypothetical protein